MRSWLLLPALVSVRASCRLHQPECDGAGWPFQWTAGASRQMKMRRAIAGVLAARLTAEGDGFAFLIAAIGVAAIAGFELQQRQMSRIGFDTAKLDSLFAFEDRHDPSG